DVHLTTALVFDVGVYLAVVGVVLAAFNLLGLPRPHERNDAGGFDATHDGDDDATLDPSSSRQTPEEANA
ncbi:MAG: hypothetical protein ACK4M5_17535, partial [Dietzia cercidiphylli]